MVWPWSNATTSPPSTDPLRDLDPSLRDFLSKESPVKYNPAPPPPPPPATTTTTDTTTTPPTSTPSSSTPPHAPPGSLYPDGRYASLWTTYKPLSTIEAESKSDQEKLSDVLEGYRARKAQIGRAAVENCVFEQMKVDECFRNGRYMSRMRLCGEESRAFDRCYIMQSRFLKALGYLSTYDRPPEVDEQIQMHADTLYHRMLSQEKAIEEAKAAGKPAPEFKPILSPEQSTGGFPSDPTGSNLSSSEQPDLPNLSPTTQSLLSPDSQLKLRERLNHMTQTERELEERSVQMEARTAGDVASRMREVEEGRKKRREQGNGTAADTIAGWFGW